MDIITLIGGRTFEIAISPSWEACEQRPDRYLQESSQKDPWMALSSAELRDCILDSDSTDAEPLGLPAGPPPLPQLSFSFSLLSGVQGSLIIKVPAWCSGLALPAARGVILETWDRVPHRAPCMEPPSPSACVSASLSLSLSLSLCVSHE